MAQNKSNKSSLTTYRPPPWGVVLGYWTVNIGQSDVANPWHKRFMFNHLAWYESLVFECNWVQIFALQVKAMNEFTCNRPVRNMVLSIRAFKEHLYSLSALLTIIGGWGGRGLLGCAQSHYRDTGLGKYFSGTPGQGHVLHDGVRCAKSFLHCNRLIAVIYHNNSTKYSYSWTIPVLQYVCIQYKNLVLSSYPEINMMIETLACPLKPVGSSTSYAYPCYMFMQFAMGYWQIFPTKYDKNSSPN